jgi:hypothetical protein
MITDNNGVMLNGSSINVAIAGYTLIRNTTSTMFNYVADPLLLGNVTVIITNATNIN